MRTLSNENLTMVSGAGGHRGGGGTFLSVGDVLSGNNVLSGNSINILSGNRYSRSETNGCCERDHGCDD